MSNICPSCNKTHESASYCPHCGAKVPSLAEINNHGTEASTLDWIPYAKTPPLQEIGIQEYRRKCNHCGTVWHSLVDRERKIQEGIGFDKGFCMSTACCNLKDKGMILSQSKRNIDAQENTLEYLRRCPNCGSINYTEEILTYDTE